MKKCLLMIALLLMMANYAFPAGASGNILKNLKEAIGHKKAFDLQYEARIENTKKLVTEELSQVQRFHFYSILCREYQKYQLDSAIRYATKNCAIARELRDRALTAQADIQLAVLYSSSGQYRESEQLLKGIDRRALNRSTLQAYYEACSLFFEHYATNSFTENYAMLIRQYRDSLLSMLTPGSNIYVIRMAERHIYRDSVFTARKDLLQLLGKLERNTSDYAMVTYLLGVTYQIGNDTEEAIRYFALSAIADIENSLKDNASMQSLASIYYDRGDIETAYTFAQSSLEDAMFSNVHFRTVRMSKFYTIINSAYLDKKSKSKNQLQKYLIFSGILLIFLVIAMIYVYYQMRKVSNIKKELDGMNKKLQSLNAEISEANARLNERNGLLTESNRVKEEYIAHFFGLCSTYIDKLENYRKSLNKKANERQLDELFRVLKSTTLVENELEELYSNFDHTFINLYPNFVEEFNALRLEGEQVFPRPGRLLNTELRVFALIRLGITDSVRIAAFLRYSPSTIYNYRTKAKSKTNVSRAEFEDMVMKIGNYTSQPV
jgi:DNA-binding CsgD family transcriptional regulator